MLMGVPSNESPLGQVVLVSGPESLLADRAVAKLLTQLRRSDPAVEISEIEASRLELGKLAEMTGASLFSTQRAAIIWDLANLPAELTDEIMMLATEPLADLALILVHGGGVKGKGLLDKLKKARVQVIDCPGEARQEEDRRRGRSVPG
jgi:DNA polymerase-3 subunit delta